MRNELDISPYATHLIDGLVNVNKSIEALHGGECLRAIVQFKDYKPNCAPLNFTQVESVKAFGGELKRIKHMSNVNQCEMTFSIFIPGQVNRTDPYPPVLYYLSGLTCTDENARTKSAIFDHAAKYGLAVVFPDTSARGVQIEG